MFVSLSLFRFSFLPSLSLQPFLTCFYLSSLFSLFLFSIFAYSFRFSFFNSSCLSLSPPFFLYSSLLFLVFIIFPIFYLTLLSLHVPYLFLLFVPYSLPVSIALSSFYLHVFLNFLLLLSLSLFLLYLFLSTFSAFQFVTFFLL
jgi:hypothetical protein